MATSARHYNYATPHRSLPITMPPKAPSYSHPISKIPITPPDISDASSTYSSSRHSGGSYSVRSGSNYAPSHISDDYSYNAHPGVDVVDMLSEHMSSAFDTLGMDKAIARQAQTSGALNAKERELAELQAMAQRRLKTARVNFAEGMEAARETRRDLEYTTKKISSMKGKAERKHPDAYAKASRRH